MMIAIWLSSFDFDFNVQYLSKLFVSKLDDVKKEWRSRRDKSYDKFALVVADILFILMEIAIVENIDLSGELRAFKMYNS